jgi:hypothetical protein
LLSAWPGGVAGFWVTGWAGWIGLAGFTGWTGLAGWTGLTGLTGWAGWAGCGLRSVVPWPPDGTGVCGRELSG